MISVRRSTSSGTRVPVAQCHMQLRLGRSLDRFGGRLFGTLALTFIAVEHIGAGDLVVFAAHQRQFDLILHILDMEGASLADPAVSAFTTSLVSCSITS